MDTIKIGTSENCDIKFYGKDITSSVWATISASDKKMLVLKILANNVRCFVNNNNVVDQYWIKYGDEICINDYTLDWNSINDLLYDDEKKSNWERYLKYAISIQLDIEKVLMVGHSDERAASIIFSSESNTLHVYDNMPLPPQAMQYKIDIESMACSPRKTIQLPSTYNQYDQLINHLKRIKCESIIEPSIYAVDTAPDILYRVRLHIDMPGYDEPMLYIDTEISHQYETKWSNSIFSLINVLMSHLPDSNTEIKRIVNKLGLSQNLHTHSITDEPRPVLYGPPIINQRTEIFSHPTVYGPPPVRESKWKFISVVILIIGALIGLFVYISSGIHSIVYGTPIPDEELDQIRQETDSISTLIQNQDSLYQEKTRSVLYGPRPVSRK